MLKERKEGRKYDLTRNQTLTERKGKTPFTGVYTFEEGDNIPVIEGDRYIERDHFDQHTLNI